MNWKFFWERINHKNYLEKKEIMEDNNDRRSRNGN